MTKLTAHRGASYCLPENTIQAFIKAIDDGADRIEFDVHQTADGEIIVHHDYYPAGSSVPIHRLSYSEVLRFHPLTPRLEKALEVIPKEVELEVELKGFSEAFIESVVEEVEERRGFASVEFTSPHVAVLTALRRYRPSSVLGFFAVPFPAWMGTELGRDILLSTVGLQGFNVIHLPCSMIDEELLYEAHKKGIKSHAANCNQEEEITRALSLKVDQLSTDHLPLALRLRDELRRREFEGSLTT